MIAPAHPPVHPSDQNWHRSTATGSIGPSSFLALREVVSASPAAARFLPHLMRSLADEIEGAAQARRDIDADRLHTVHDGEALARRIAEELSTALSCHLTASHGQTTNAISDTPLMPVMPVMPVMPKMPETASETPPLGAHDGLSERAGGLAVEENEKPTAARHLQLKLLGTPEITLDGVRLEAVERSDRVRLIPYILALFQRGLSAERLTAYMASDEFDLDTLGTDAGIGPGTVRTFIWRLRKRAGWRGIVVSPGEHGGCSNTYRLPEQTSCDLWEFERNLAESARLVVRANVDPGAADRAAALRQEAILLYQGDFCKGVSAGCISHAAQQLRSRYLEALLRQAAYWKDQAARLRDSRQGNDSGGTTTASDPVSAEEQNAWLEALSNYRLAVLSEPYDEAAYVGAMQCLAHLGNSKGVQEMFVRCSQVIQDELDRTPLASTIHAAREYLVLAGRG